MRRYTPQELRKFLTAVDTHLSKRVRMNVMGGGAIALAHGVDRNTTDLDTFETNMRAISAAIERAHAETGLHVPVSPSGGAVGDVPYDSDTRMIRVLPKLKRLSVYALEQHDVALSKTVRGYENDMVAIEQLHAAVHLDPAVLLQRYVNEMSHAIIDPARLEQNFVLLMDRLFGEMEAERVRGELAKRSKKRRR